MRSQLDIHVFILTVRAVNIENQTFNKHER